MADILGKILFPMKDKLMLLEKDQLGENIERIFSEKNVFRLIYGSVSGRYRGHL